MDGETHSGDTATWSGAPSPDAKLLAIIDELARSFDTEAEASALLRGVGFPLERAPQFSTALAYWSKVVTAAQFGALKCGAIPLILAAAKGFPHNKVFRDFLGTKPHTKRSTYKLTLQLDEISPEQLNEIIDKLRVISSDASLSLLRIEKGSIVLVLDIDDDAAEEISDLLERGDLSGEIGYEASEFCSLTRREAGHLQIAQTGHLQIAQAGLSAGRVVLGAHRALDGNGGVYIMPSTDRSMPSTDRVEFERDLYRNLLLQPSHEQPSQLLDLAIETLCRVTTAEIGFIEIEDEMTGHYRSWSAHVGLEESDLETVRRRVSTGVIAEARMAEETIHVPSALLDDRFDQRESVQSDKFETVLCVPIFAKGVSGVIYLQKPSGGGVFGQRDIICTETVALHLSSRTPLLIELLARRNARDTTAEIRETLQCEEILGRSSALARLLRRLGVIAGLAENVLILGPSGSGKSMLARTIHNNSDRAGRAFVEINTPAIPDALLESELFGALPGSFTGSSPKGLAGKVAEAEGGTLFLDEIGDLKEALQAKLLQLLESKQYYPVGSNRPRGADVRIIAATNHDLPADVANGIFRGDLFHRLDRTTLQVPPLDARREDIAMLASYFVAEMCARNNLQPMEFSPSALIRLEVASWPGNVRQLQNRCYAAVINARLDSSNTIELYHLDEEQAANISGVGPTAIKQGSLRAARAIWERAFLEKALSQNGWNVKQTAIALSISRSVLHKKIKEYELSRGR